LAKTNFAEKAMTAMPANSRLQNALAHHKKVWCWKRKNWRYMVPDIAFGILLGVAKNHAGITHKSLFQDLPCSQPTATKWLKKMERDGWIEIVENSKDRRVSYIKLAAKGEGYLIDCWRVQRKRVAPTPK
jgi:hypothetical protein